MRLGAWHPPATSWVPHTSRVSSRPCVASWVLRATGLASPDSYLVPRPACRACLCVLILGVFFCFFFFQCSRRVCICVLTRDLTFCFSSCGLLSRSVRKCCLGCSEPLSCGFHWFRVHVLVGALGSYDVARVTRFRVALWWKFLAAFPCFSSRSTPHVRNACVLGAVLWEPNLVANARLLASASQGSGSFVELALLCAVWQHRA